MTQYLFRPSVTKKKHYILAPTAGARVRSPPNFVRW